jgi:hypothetical protein
LPTSPQDGSTSVSFTRSPSSCCRRCRVSRPLCKTQRRDRRLAGLRRADPGARRHAQPLHRVHPEIRQAVSPLGDEIRAPAREYAEEVRQGRFPAAAHTYSR